MPVDVVTGDRDLFQVVDDERQVRVLYIARGVGKHEMVDDAWVRAKYDIPAAALRRLRDAARRRLRRPAGRGRHRGEDRRRRCSTPTATWSGILAEASRPDGQDQRRRSRPSWARRSTTWRSRRPWWRWPATSTSGSDWDDLGSAHGAGASASVRPADRGARAGQQCRPDRGGSGREWLSRTRRAPADRPARPSPTGYPCRRTPVPEAVIAGLDPADQPGALWGDWFGGGVVLLRRPAGRAHARRRATDGVRARSTTSPSLTPPVARRPGRRRLARLLGYDPARTASRSTTRCCAGGRPTGWVVRVARTARAGGRRRARPWTDWRWSRSAEPPTAPGGSGPVTGPVFARRRTPASTRDRYLAAVEQVIGRIHRGDFYQLNLCLRLHAPAGRPAAGALRPDRRPGCGRRTRPWSPGPRPTRLGGQLQPGAVPAGAGPAGDHLADQGHGPAQRIRRSRGAAVLGQGRRREHHDRRPDAQRPVPGLPARHGRGGRAARRAAPSRACGTWSPRCTVSSPTGSGTADLLAATFPPGLGHRCAQAGGRSRASPRWSRSRAGAYTGGARPGQPRRPAPSSTC